MKSIRRGQHLITIMLLIFLIGFGYLIYRLQRDSGFYISHASSASLGCVYDRSGEVLFDPHATAEDYGGDYFLDVGNLIGDDSRQMTNTLVSQNKADLANFSFMLGEQKDGKAAIYTTLDHNVNRKVYNAFGSKDGCAVAYNYKTGEIYVCLSKPSVNILNHYNDITNLKEGSLLCKVFYPTVPGSTQKISTTIAALESMGYDTLCSKSFSCAGTYNNNHSQVIKCHSDGHGTQDIYAAFANSCNPYFAQLIEDSDWSLADIQKTYRSMGYRVNGQGDLNYLDINGISAYTASTDVSDKDDFDSQWGCMGQGTTLVSPLQMMVWQSAIANQTGASTMPYLISYTKSVSGDRKNEAVTKTGSEMFSARSATYIRDIMLRNGKENYAGVLPGTDIGVKSGTAQVKNGTEENSLLTGFVDDEDFPIAFCIVIENRVKGEVSTSDIASVMLQQLKASLNAAE
ncbi:MAG: ABC transporter permease [Oscillospiraceae bacterium]|nr:ABC transporter permease [Oscillospiraceae bacterium]